MTKHVDSPPGDEFISQLTQHQAALHGYVLASLGDVHDAKDVLQRVNIVLWRKAAAWDSATKFLPWAFAVARFEVLAHIRDRAREKLVFDPDVVELMSQTSAVVLHDQSERHDALQRCLEKMRLIDRALLSDHYVAGRTLREIAEAAGRQAGAVRIQIMRLRQMLADCIRRKLETEAMP